MPKYPGQQIGNPLEVLGEESSEVVQAVFKVSRFGLDGHPNCKENGLDTPRDILVQEIGDFLWALERVVKSGVLGTKEEAGFDIQMAMMRKRQRIAELYEPDELA